MISPSGLTLKRPGILLPVFFLSLIHLTVTSQVQWQGAASAALGGSHAASQGYWCSNQNQAGLGFIEQSSLALQHGRPYLLKELGISAFSGQFTSGSGAIGIALATQGLQGFRQSSVWLSCGLKLHPHISAGVGLHLWNSTVEKDLIYAPGISFALALQIRINKQWMAGARVLHPAEWSAHPVISLQHQMIIESGISYSFLKTGRICADIHFKPGEGLILCQGLEWTLNSRCNLRTGICNRPFTFSWGISLKFKNCLAEFSFGYRTGSGISPLTSLSHVW